MGRRVKDIRSLYILMCGCRDKIKNQSSDWNEDKIAISESYGSDWSSSVAENERYIFYLTQDGIIMRFDKKAEEAGDKNRKTGGGSL